MSWSKEIDSLRAQASKRGVLVLLIASWRMDIYSLGNRLFGLIKMYEILYYSSDEVIYQWLTRDVNVKETPWRRAAFEECDLGAKRENKLR